jgi:hypothetical protein
MSKSWFDVVNINQGVIGRVGGTGLTGSCLLSFWKNGRQVDALKLKLPGGEPMKSAIKLVF